MHQGEARSCCACSTSGSVKPMELVLQRCIGELMEQTVDYTCSLVACTVAVEAVNRFVYEKEHGEGTFPYRAAPPDDLLEACRADKIWMPGKGADVWNVLTKIRAMGGVPATTVAPTPAAQRRPLLLPLRSWREHSSWDDLLYDNGPCIGLLWISPWYWRLDADRDGGRKVYTSGGGRARSHAAAITFTSRFSS